MDPRASERGYIRSNDCYYYRVKRKRDAYSQMDISDDAVNLDVKYDLSKWCDSRGL